MQQANNMNTEAQVDNRKFETKRVRMADLVGGHIADKRRIAIHPDRIEQALQGEFRDLALAIHETGEYVVVMSCFAIDDVRHYENMPQTMNSDIYGGAGTRMAAQAMPSGFQNVFGLFGGRFLNGQPLTFALFSGDGGEGLLVALNPQFFYPQQQYGEGAVINVALDLIQGENERPIGFSKAVK